MSSLHSMEALISRIRDDQTAVEAAAHSLAVRCHQHDFADSRLLRTQATKRTKKTARGRAHDRENTAPGYRDANDGGGGYLADPADAAYGPDTLNGATCLGSSTDASPAHAHTIGPGTYNPRPSEFERGTALARRPSPWSLSTHASGKAGKAGKAARGGALLSGDGGDELALGALGSLGGGVCNNGRDIPAEQLERARNAVRKRTDIGVLTFAPPPPVGGRGRGSYGRDDGGGDDDGGGSGIGGSGDVGGAGKGKGAASLLLDPRRGGPEAGDYNPAQVRRRRRRKKTLFV